MSLELVADEEALAEGQPERPRRPLEGRLVQLHSFPGPLEPNSETRDAASNARPLDFNGKAGRALYWDEEEEKYVVHTFEGTVVGAPEENVAELRPEEPEDGGFDVAWPTGDAFAYGVFAGMVGDCLSTKGYCVLQMFTNQAVRDAAVQEARDMPPFEELRDLFEEGYLGSENTTRCAVLDQDAPDRELLTALSFCDRDLSHLGVMMRPLAPEVLGSEVVSRSVSLLRTPFPGGGVVPAPPLSDEDIRQGKTEEFMSWVMRRKLCMLYLVENEGGVLELYPKEHLDMDTITLPLQRCRIVLFRPDLMGYSYRPEGDSVALQMWLLDEPKSFQFRQMQVPPGIQGVNRVHITGAAERFPANCEGCDMSWAFFTTGGDALTWCPFARFDPDLYSMVDRDAPMYGKAYTMHGSFISNDILVGFDNEFFGYNEEEAFAIAPSQRWVLEVGYTCLFKAGWSKQTLMGKRIGTFMGDSGSEWNFVYWKQDKHVEACNLGVVTVNRLSNVLGLTGPNVTVDTACSASLVAANSAAHWMRSATFQKDGRDIRSMPQTEAMQQYALCQGILCMVAPHGWIGECSATMLSIRGRCFTFDNSADGFIRGEGSCCAFLETKHDDNVDPGDRSLGVLLSSAVNQDGRSASLTAPHGPSQQECIRISLRESNLIPGEIFGTECHGTGTALGDPIEVGANRGVMFGHRDERTYCHATAKAHVGHEEANAGICGLLKVILMMNACAMSPNPHIRALNPHLDVNAYPVLFCSELTSMESSGVLIGVSSFGFGGTNSRGDAWAEPEKGVYKDGRATELGREEAARWIEQLMQNVGTEDEQAGFLSHKLGH